MSRFESNKTTRQTYGCQIERTVIGGCQMSWIEDLGKEEIKKKLFSWIVIGLFVKIIGKALGKSAMTTRFGEQEQSSPPQQPFFFFLESEQDFLQQSFWQFERCWTLSFLHLSFPHAHTGDVVTVVKTNNKIQLSDMETMNFTIE